MKLVLAAAAFIGGGAWVFGAVTGRLASMIAAAVSPTWVGKGSASGSGTAAGSSSSGSGGGILGDAAKGLQFLEGGL